MNSQSEIDAHRATESLRNLGLDEDLAKGLANAALEAGREHITREDLQAELAHLQGEIEKLWAEMEKLQTGQEELRVDLAALRDKVEKLQDGVTEMRGKIENLQDGVTELRGKVENLQDGQADLRVEFEKLRSDVVELIQTMRAELQRSLRIQSAYIIGILSVIITTVIAVLSAI